MEVGKNQRRLNQIGLASVGLLVASLGFMCLPFVEPQSYAASDQSTSAEVTTIAIAVEKDLALTATPRPDGDLAEKTIQIRVSTNNATGYELLISTANGQNALKTGDEGTAEILATAPNTARDAFLANTWGYKIDKATEEKGEDVFQPVPIERTAISSAEQAADDVYDFTVAAKVDSSLPSGQYRNTIMFSAVANPKASPDLAGITYMQEMTPEVCAKTAEGTEVRLVDSRDGNKYYVAKLKDGNCWMTQNLAFDLKEGEVLTTEESDLEGDWEVPANTETAIPKAETVDRTAVRSWNLGKIVAKNPTEGKQCSNVPNTQTILSYCGTYYQSVDGMDDTYKASSTSSISGNTYDAHYLIGNYYTWNAVTAETGKATDAINKKLDATKPETFINAEGSICPKGWQLPVGGAKGYTPQAFNKSFYALMLKYGYPETTNQQTVLWGDGITRADYKPISLVRSGQIIYRDGNLSDAGILGRYWSSTAYPNDTSNTYNYYILGGNGITGSYNLIYPSSHSYRWVGASARCVAR